MLFNIEADEGTRIVGYLVSDSFSESPSLRVSDGKRDLATLACQEERMALVFAGRHVNGRCGFTIDASIIPDLDKQLSLELYDVGTGLMIYRRRAPAEVVQKRILRLETHLVPLWRLDNSLERHFQWFYKSVERYGRETTSQLFHLSKASSLYVSGRLTFKSYENELDEAIHCIALLRDPYIELAERILALKNLRRLKVAMLGERDMIFFAPAIEFAEALEFARKPLHRGFAAMPKAAIASFANPITRQLAARSAEEVPLRGAVSAALSTLSRFAVVGLREHQKLFLTQVGDLLGIDGNTLVAVPELSESGDLARKLKTLPEVELLIEQDLEVYHHVKAAVENAVAA